MDDSKRIRIEGSGITVRGNDIDTDRIIPARYLKVLTFDALDRYVFADDRRQMREQGRLHAFDDPRYDRASILLVNRNFGCGSSREHAPQAIRRRGVRAIVGESFAEIFLGNSVSIGMPCVTASEDATTTLQDLALHDPALSFALDIETLCITTSDGRTFSVAMPDGARLQFLTGRWDACGHLLEAKAAIEAMDLALPYGFPRHAATLS
jgi:3-isopropylmalate/(R)-2-methylmalate dehydratase small subunit